MPERSIDPGQLRAVVRQHAETSSLLGVEFVPVFPSDRIQSNDADGPRATPPLSPPPARDDGGDQSPKKAALFPEPKPASVPPAAPSAPHAPARSQPVGKSSALPREQRMAELRARYEREAPHASFVTSFSNIVWGDGDLAARLMFVGEAPGADEDRTGVPFVGRAGQLLNKMIEAMGLRREQVYIANVLKTRPPNNATPTAEEAAACAPYLFEQISIVAPDALVALGLPAARTLLATSEAMGRLRGRWHAFEDPHTGRSIPLMPTYHPAYLLRAYTVENRNMVWSDLQQVMQVLGLGAAR